YEVEVSGNHFLVKLDGRTLVTGRDDKSRAGHLGLQYNKDKKIEFRNLKLKPLGLQPLFNGKDLKGWQVVDAPKPREMPVWAATAGAIHVEKGPGQLETEATFADFVFQLDIRANASGPNHHPNSGVFFRGDVKGYWTGYESQIRNEYKAGDRAQPVDTGTGGLYFYHPARRVVSNDNEYFTKTIVARGRHIAIWINGYPTADHEDARAEGMNARKEARLAGGTISLQAHDPTTNLDFRNLRIAALP
ncbi:MAG: family 16 glycoside hydrolase, partial [Bryobacteraceae bacterium]